MANKAFVRGILGQATRHLRSDQQRSSGGLSELFSRAAQRSADAFGSSWAFVIALAVVAVWGATGPLFGFSDTWQLVINTGTTIVTFLMVFMIQNAQNRDAKALHLKLDELIHGLSGARNRLIDLEHCTEQELEDLQKEFARVAKKEARRSERAN
jgi:low affinity Fe/Cu permease